MCPVHQVCAALEGCWARGCLWDPSSLWARAGVVGVSERPLSPCPSFWACPSISLVPHSRTSPLGVVVLWAGERKGEAGRDPSLDGSGQKPGALRTLHSPDLASVPHLRSVAPAGSPRVSMDPGANSGSCPPPRAPLPLSRGVRVLPTLGSIQPRVPHLGLEEALGALDALGGDIDLGEAGEHVQPAVFLQLPSRRLAEDQEELRDGEKHVVREGRGALVCPSVQWEARGHIFRSPRIRGYRWPVCPPLAPRQGPN